MSTSAKKKGKPGRKAPPKKKAKTTKVRKVAKAPAAEKPKKAAKPKVEKTEKVERESPPKTVRKSQPAELGPTPSAVIASRHLDSMHERSGRGFSFAELTSAGVEFNLARREGLSVDVRRRSAVDQNVEALKQWLKTAVAAKPAGEPVALAAVGKKK
jgi:ribosomal protein L13E